MKLTEAPGATLVDTGSVVTVGLSLTVSVADELVTEPDAPVIFTVNFAPLSASVTTGDVYVAAVAPLIATPSRYHWNENGGLPVTPTSK